MKRHMTAKNKKVATDFGYYKADAHNWITLATGEFYPDILPRACELYNLSDDPSEQRNLYYRGQFGEVIESCTNEIQGWQRKTADTVKLQSN